MLSYSVIILTLIIVCHGSSIKESYSCRNSKSNEVCVGHQLDCEEGKEIYVLNGRYMYSRTETNCSSLSNGKCMVDNRSYCSRDYSYSAIDDALLKCNGLRSCRPSTTRKSTRSYCIKFGRNTYPIFHRFYTLSYLSYTCISPPKILRIGDNIGATKTVKSSHVVVMGNINRNINCSFRVYHSTNFVFIHNNKEKKSLRYRNYNLRPLHRYNVKVIMLYRQHYFQLSFQGPLTDLKINVTSIGGMTRDLKVTTKCSMGTATKYPNTRSPNHKTTTTGSILSSMSTRKWFRNKNGFDEWEDIEDSDGNKIQQLFNTTTNPSLSKPVLKEWKTVFGVCIFAFIAFFIAFSIIIIILKRRSVAKAKVRQQRMAGIGNPIYREEPFVLFHQGPPPGYFDHMDGFSRADIATASLPPSYSRATGGQAAYLNASAISGPPTYSNAKDVSDPPTYSNVIDVSGPPTYSNATDISGPPIYSNATGISGPLPNSNASDISDPQAFSKENGISFINVRTSK